MTAKEHAHKLVDKFKRFVHYSEGNNSMNRQIQMEDNAKQCALIAINEVIDACTCKYDYDLLDKGLSMYDARTDYFKYIETVKQEIEKLYT